MLSADIFLMRQFYILFIYDRVMKRCVYLCMAQKFLELFDRHAFFNRHSGHGPPEFVRMDVVDMGGAAELGQKPLHTGDRQAVPGRVEPDEKRAVRVLPFCEILLEMDFRFRVKVDSPFFIPFSQDDALPAVKINIRPVQVYQFSHTDPGGDQEIDDRQVSGMAALIPQALQILVSQSLFYKLSCFDFVDAAHRTFGNIVLILQPDEERRHNVPNIVYGHFS